MTDVIVVIILVVLIGAALRYIIKAKKSGARCIGCSVGECPNHRPAKASEKAPSSESPDSEPCTCCCHAEKE